MPERVLVEVRDLLAEVPDLVLLVSDYEVLRPDPFLAVTTRALLESGQLWVVDRWDEPDWGAETAHGRAARGMLAAK